MRTVADTIKRLNAWHGATGHIRTKPNSRLKMIQRFGSNPGNLLAWEYVPETLTIDAPLVVVLHGCTQTAADYDSGPGWSDLADRHGFALLFPEQQRANNPNLCFNWFAPADTTRGHGEVPSIRQMVAAATAAHSIDRRKIFITGLSAGGAMAAAMLATYPEVFRGGAIIAGLPYGTATSIPEAFDRMRGYGLQESSILADQVRRASDHKGPWPTVSIWHGTADSTVDPINMEALVAQWHGIHNVNETHTTALTGGHTVRRWNNLEGVTVIEAHAIKGMGHGTPVNPSGIDPIGQAQPFILDVGISSTRHIADSWNIVGAERSRAPVTQSSSSHPRKTDIPNNQQRSVSNVIEDALRAAGLMK